MKIQNMFCFWSQGFFRLVKFTVEKWPTPGTKIGVFRYFKIKSLGLKKMNFRKEICITFFDWSQIFNVKKKIK
jgi:hypothetical protein